jgi:hypothetical protein
MEAYKVFVASSMTDEDIRKLRSGIDEVVKEVNRCLMRTSTKVSYRVDVVGETVGASGNEDSQADINSMINSCDLFVMILKNGALLGPHTFREYRNALLKSKTSANKKPLIKIYLLKDDDKDQVSVSYIDDLRDGLDEPIAYDDLENRVYIDSKRYIDIVTSDSFDAQLSQYLMFTYPEELKKFRQSEISYENHISGTTQELIRNHNHKYFRREDIDNRIESIEAISSLLILEGNTYSGKTRAAYELMKQDKWKDAIFHVYRCNHDASIDDLDTIAFNTETSPQHKVIFIDDINEVINENTQIDGGRPLWSELRLLSASQPPQWKNTTLILTIAGKLSRREKTSLYRKIFGENYDALKPMLDGVTVNFDVYDRVSFKKMVNMMVKDGVIPKGKVRPGNYTIGSLFINDEVVRNQIRTIRNEYGDIMLYTLRTIKLNWMYASKFYKGYVTEMKRLYGFLTGVNENQPDHPLDKCIDILRSRGFVFCHPGKVMIDSFVVEAIANILDRELTDASDSVFKKDQRDIDDLLNYALTMSGESQNEDKYQTITCAEQMGYMLCERAELSDDAILYLVKCVYNKVYQKNFNSQMSVANITALLGEICKKQTDLIYSKNFCATAVMRLRDFQLAYDIMIQAKHIISKAKDDDNKRIYTTLYKEIAYALIAEQRHLNTYEEELILNEIFQECHGQKKVFTAPFDEKDLERVHILKRMIPHLYRDNMEIICLAENAHLDKDSDADSSIVDDKDESFFDVDEPDDAGSSENKIERILLPQLRYVAISAMKKTDDFDGFMAVIDRLRHTTSTYLKRALDTVFAVTFYVNVKDIIARYSYEDRFRFFEFVLNLKDPACIIEHDAYVSNAENTENASVRQIFALNSILPLLDESDSLKAYYIMKDKHKVDGFTFSILMKNEFLSFEHLFHIASGDEGKYLIYNQLLGKAQTIDDAKACLKLMGISDADPAKLKDDFALGRYLEIKYVKAEDCIDIIKRRRCRYPDTVLTPITLGIIVGKLSFRQLKEIFDADIDTLGYYGLTPDEIMEIRKNAVCNHKFFYKAKEYPGTGQYLKDRFDFLMNDDELRPIVVDSEYNAATAILSVYLKNSELFPTYDDMWDWWMNFYYIDGDKNKLRYPNLKITPYIYRALLWALQDMAEVRGRDWARTKINELLLDAYGYFARHDSKSKVISNMSSLYSYIIRIVKEEDIERVLPYAYERELVYTTLPGYLKHILDRNSAYADGTFVLYTLEVMQENIHQEVYDLISMIARKNRNGITLDSLDKKDRKLSVAIKWRLLNVNDGEIYVNKDLISNFSYIKMLWWLLSTGQISYFDAKNLLEKNPNIHVTQSYLNLAFSKIYKAFNKRPEAYEEMKRLLDTYVVTDSPAFFKSIQMFLPMIAASNSEEQLQETLDMFPMEFRNAPQYLGAVLQKHIGLRHVTVCYNPDVRKLLDTLKELLVTNREMVTIHHVNSYILTLMMILKGEIRADRKLKTVVLDHMQRCWDYMYDAGYVNVNELLNISGEDWTILSNVQTYIYFPMLDPMLPVYIDDLFYGNYTYGKNKDCLHDCINNYSFFCADNYEDDAVDVFAKALSKNFYKNVRRDICTDNLFHAKNSITDFQLDLAYACPELIKEAYECILKGYLGKNKIQHLLNNEVRLEQLRQLFRDDKRFMNQNPTNIRKENQPLYDAIFNM